MSKKWSSYEKDGKIMESWRNYVEGPPTYRFLQEGPDYILTEQDLQELFGKANWEKLVDRFAIEDDGAADLAQRLGLKSAEVTDAEGQALDVAQIEAKIKQVMDVARKSNDPELADAAQDLAQNAQQVAQGASAEEATADDDEGEAEAAPGEEPEDESLSLKQLEQGDVKMALSVLNNTAGLNAKKLAQTIDDGFEKALQGNPYAGQMRDEQLPMINLVRDEIVKILSGDFSNLVRESQGSHYKVHPATYLFFQTIISNR
jgi:plasmid stabilization system protein ParE